MLFCRIGYFTGKPYEIPLVLFSSSCAPFYGLLSLGCECADYTVFCNIIKFFCTVGNVEEFR